MQATRTIHVPGERLVGWAARFAAAHGGYTVETGPGRAVLRTPDGFTAELDLPPWPAGRADQAAGPEPAEKTEHAADMEPAGPESADGAGGTAGKPQPTDGAVAPGGGPVAALAALAAVPRRAGIILVRRGGYAVGVAEGPRLTASKCGTRYVQSRTAAGGWSQQRFARRRANQADALVETVAGHAARLIAPAGVGYLATGGDKSLIAAVLAEPSCRPLLRLPAVPAPLAGDPRLGGLQEAARTLASVRITVTDP